MLEEINLPQGKKIYFISDFHLGAPDPKSSLLREKRIVRWLDMVQYDAAHIFFLGDIFDFWFEYKHTIPKGFTRFLGKIALLRDTNIPITFFTGNHDMWMFDYFPKELGIPVIKTNKSLIINKKKFMLGHGDGLGPGDYSYKMIKKIFANSFFQWVFSIAPPTLGIGIAQLWSKKSRINNKSEDEKFLGEKEWIYNYCKEVENNFHHDYYVFGHRHLPMEMQVATNSRYINLGEWVNYNTYLEFDGTSACLKRFESE
ncbi:MAG: UDP-2,3-diacylglucosamine diphosphatase [Cytophagales bacterium]|nr:MAG: UDP-2,3-diacylglucosamine diphosphatase [Cytophagales bacterium]